MLTLSFKNKILILFVVCIFFVFFIFDLNELFTIEYLIENANFDGQNSTDILTIQLHGLTPEP